MRSSQSTEQSTAAHAVHKARNLRCSLCACVQLSLPSSHAALLPTALAWCTCAHRAQQGRSDVQVDNCASTVRNAGGLHLKQLGPHNVQRMLRCCPPPACSAPVCRKHGRGGAAAVLSAAVRMQHVPCRRPERPACRCAPRVTHAVHQLVTACPHLYAWAECSWVGGIRVRSAGGAVHMWLQPCQAEVSPLRWAARAPGSWPVAPGPGTAGSREGQSSAVRCGCAALTMAQSRPAQPMPAPRPAATPCSHPHRF